MPSLNPEGLLDFVNATLPKFSRPNIVLLLSDTQKYPFAKNMLNKARMKITDGRSFTFPVDMDTEHQAGWISMTTHDSVAQYNSQQTATAYLKKAEAKYSFFLEEVDFNRGESALYDLVGIREKKAMFDWFALLEESWWNTLSLAQSATQMNGLPLLVTKNATEGFNGGHLTGFSDVHGISATTFPRWKNYTAQYTDITLADFVDKARTMAMDIHFEAPVSIPQFGEGLKRQFYANKTVIKGLENLCDSRNQNIGPDVAYYSGRAMFQNAPVDWVPTLDSDSTGPFYALDWDSIKILVQSSWWMRKRVLAPWPGQRNRVAVFFDSYIQPVVLSRRANAILSTGTSYPS